MYVWKPLLILFTLIIFCEYASSLQKLSDIKCDSTTIYPFLWSDHAPRDNRSSGNFSESNSTDILGCTANCCNSRTCNVAMYYNKTCFLIECITSAGCLPVKRNLSLSSIDLEMVLVRTVPDEHVSWEEVIASESEKEDIQQQQPQAENNPNLDILKQLYNYDMKEKLLKTLQQIKTRENFEKMSNAAAYGHEIYTNNNSEDEDDVKVTEDVKFCGIDVGNCDMNEECIRFSETGAGICRCKRGYRMKKKKCVRSIIPVVAASFTETFPPKYPDSDDDEEPEKIKLQVSVESKKIQLPENKASLTANVVPDNEKYSFLWSLVDKPDNDKNGTITDQTRQTVRVSNLSEGLYRFKVTVTGTNSYGETFVNLTVLPAKRLNKFPTVIIHPKYQMIKLPNNKAVLDGSTSYDDDKIENWKWELVQGPINYSPTLQEQPTIELNDLKEPGNYTFKLTVTDSDKAENSTTAVVEVREEIDYPPQSNAGSDVILYLPHNNVTLNGTLSTDDHQIVSWEWTKDASDEAKAVDMQNTHTPYLSLSHLEEGIYTFELKVTDAKGQSSVSKVHVFVKPPTNLPPVARAVSPISISLPITWAILNASESSDDIKITQFLWRQVSGPSNSIILNANTSLANATSLKMLGDYIFEVTVVDENNNNATDHVKVTVVQEKNAAPVAKIIGGNQNISLPLSVLVINGSASYDDLAIVNYTWTRESDSLAVGNVIANSEHESVLMLTNIVAGVYKYKLTVADEQGLTGSEIVTINIFEDPLIMNLVEVILTAKSTTLSQQELDQLKQKLLLLLGDNVKLNVRHVRVDEKTGHVILVFYVSHETKDGLAIMNALEVQHILKEKFWKDYSILGSSISEIRTVVCQNDCSGHGKCDQETRECLCDTFWMADIFYYWHVTEANCDWSILYVIVFILFMFLTISGICYGLTYTCRTRKSKPTKNTSSRPTRLKRPQKYALLHSNDDELPSFNRNTLSDTDTEDSDVLFENSRNKSNGIRNGKSRKLKLGRRIKA
ncbi:hypothetical protein PVAND_013458 [Polypedilum vanderplanki]|uniref:EGF-like domain-containing protein n=1 Tax=Polypedilum vanderplanki TaxID=319348 RepID=A0A9J6CQQ7_POLVA|nr:hypothetical protein PVAND_013458 [Polypedilum vanderplanki]